MVGIDVLLDELINHPSQKKVPVFERALDQVGRQAPGAVSARCVT
ncbi:hypothetical protein [Streptomyces sp. Isolate_45]|nr:hypothetical protein [Streptomyces sp. Isolate_45]MDA5279593.1 hypothetical protein [Streptomyces sp. Isolate_45]